LIGYDFDSEPYCQYSIIKDGKAFHKAAFQKDQLPRSVMMHDFFVTTNYSIIMDFPLLFDMNEAKQGKNPLEFRKDLPARLGVFPKYYGAGGQGGLKWITVKTCYVFHTLNAWEQIDSNGDILIYLIASRMLDFSMTKFVSDNFTRPYLWIVNYSQGSLQYEGSLIEDDLPYSADFPRMNPSLLGKPSRFGYFVLFDDKDERPFTTGVLKLDISVLSTGNWSFTNPPPKCSYSYFLYGSNKLGGECYFQPMQEPKVLFE
jgi:carotenoid cleavage dioxygenase